MRGLCHAVRVGVQAGRRHVLAALYKAGRIFSACGGASLYRKSILDEIGLFDELFFAYFEDVDISWRANSLGYKNLYCPVAKCYHICGADDGRSAVQRIQKRAERAQQHSATSQKICRWACSF